MKTPVKTVKEFRETVLSELNFTGTKEKYCTLYQIKKIHKTDFSYYMNVLTITSSELLIIPLITRLRFTLITHNVSFV